MQILEVTRQFYPSIGGMEKFVDDRLNIYQYLGYNYQVIATNHFEKKLSSGKKIKDVKYLPSYTPYEIVPSLGKTMKLEYDVLSVHKVGYYYADYAISKAYNDGKKIILTPHLYFHTDRYRFIKEFHFKWVLPIILKKVDKVICFTEFEANFWLNNFSFLESKIEIIPHYFQPSSIMIKDTKNNYGEYFLFLGRGEKNKRIDLLIPAFDDLKSNHHLVLTVDNDELSQSNRKIVENNNLIHVLGRISEDKKQNLLANCLALVFPTDYEAFGIVNFEASYFKKVLLLSELEVFKCYLNSSGVLYFKNSVESIKEKLNNFILLGESKVKDMGNKNFLNLNKYEFETISEKYFRMFNQLI